MRILNVALVLLSAACGLTIGAYLPLAVFGRFAGFRLSVFTLPVSILLGLMSGYLLASRFEDLLGPNIGIPLGILIGCFVGSFIATCIIGGIGVIIQSVFGN